MDAHGTLMGIGGRLLSDTLRLSIHKRSSAVSLFLLSFAFGPVGADTPIREGDHIAIVGNTYADQLRIHGYLETLLLQRSSGKPVSIRNLGWAGDMLHARDRPTNFPSESSTLTAHKTDVIIACFGMGESFAGHEGLADFRKSLEAWLASHRGKKYNGTSEVRTILVSPIASENLGEHTPNSEKRNRLLGDYMQAMGEVASQNQIPFVNLFDRTRYLMNDPAGPKMTVNGIRLNAYGYWATSRLVAEALLPGASPWQFQVEARAGTALASGATISALMKNAEGISFVVQEDSWPTMASPVSGGAHAALSGSQDTLVVKNLPPGDYLLMIDGQRIMTGTHQQWARGLVLRSTPAHRSLEAYRMAVNDKNLQFTYSWKALNQVHIVGERKQSNSGRALPAEVLEFNKLAIRKDKALAAGIELKKRTWRLIRTPKPTRP
ncbi:MAG: SGNH/GDSL hydrolase family protein [Roseibacillus sp.]